MQDQLFELALQFESHQVLLPILALSDRPARGMTPSSMDGIKA